MLCMGVTPIPPATKTSGIVLSLGSTKSPIGSASLSGVPSLSENSVFLNVLLWSPAYLVVMLSMASVGELDTVNQRRWPRLSALSCGRYSSVNWPAVYWTGRSGLNQNVRIFAAVGSLWSKTTFILAPRLLCYHHSMDWKY